MYITWTVALLCGCSCLWTGTSGSSISRKTKLFPLSELSKQLQYRQLNHDSSSGSGSGSGGGNTTSPYQPWIRCPILDLMLEQYLSGFPEVGKAIDSFQISSSAINDTLVRVVNTFFYIQNPRIAVDLLINDLAILILDKRANCTVTMYQKVFTYTMTKQMDLMMSPDEASMLSQVIGILSRHFPSRPDMIILAPQIVYGVHQAVFQEIIDSLQHAEFRYLDWFLHIVRFNVRTVLETNAQLTSDDLLSKMADIVQRGQDMFPEIWQCTSVNNFIAIHTMVGGQFSDHFFKMLRTGHVSAIIVSNINLLLRLPGNGLTSPLDMDDPQVDLAVNALESIILNYATDVMNETASFEQSLIAQDLTQPPQYLLDLLCDGSYLNFTVIISQGRRELDELNNIMAGLIANNSTAHMLIIQMTSIIAEKKAFLDRLENQLQ